MLLVNIHAPGQFKLDEVPVPQPGPADVLVDVAACGICGSDLGYVAAGGVVGPSGQPMPLGHELSGTVSAVGAQVRDIQPGQRVVVNPMGADNLIGNGGPEGGFAPQLLVRNAAVDDSLFLLPEQLDFELGALVEPLAVATHGVNKADPVADSKVLVLGAGPIGLATVAVLRYRGVRDIAVMDLSPQRLQRAGELGANALIRGGEGEFAGQVIEHQGSATFFGMPVPATDIYIEATGVGPVLSDVLNSARPGATVVVVGLHKQDMAVSFGNILARELTIRGAMGYPEEFPQVIDMLVSGAVDVSPMVSHRFPLQQFAEAFATASDADAAAKVIVTMP